MDFTNLMIGTAVADQPAVMTASGFEQDTNGNWVLNKDSKGAKQLSKNLATIAGIGSSVIAAPKIIATAPTWIPWVAKNLVLPVLAGKFVDDGSRMLTGSTLGEQISDKLLKYTGLNKNWADPIGELANPMYWLNYGGMAKLITPYLNNLKLIIGDNLLKIPYKPFLQAYFGYKLNNLPLLDVVISNPFKPKIKTRIGDLEVGNLGPVILENKLKDYFWYPEYGWRRKQGNPKILGELYGLPSNARMSQIYERPSLLTEAEKAGIPKGERNLPIKPSYNALDEYIKLYGEAPGHLRPYRVEEVLPNLLSTKGDSLPFSSGKYVASTDNFYILGDLYKDYINNLRKYLETLPKTNTKIDNYTIIDFRNFLDRHYIDPYELTDDEISMLILDLYLRLSAEMTGKLKGVPLYHGSHTPVVLFNFLGETGKGMGNMGAMGPGNYFSTGRHNYGLMKVWNELRGEVLHGDMLPYLITGVESTPFGTGLLANGILPRYVEPPSARLYFGNFSPGSNNLMSDALYTILRHSYNDPRVSALEAEFLKRGLEAYLNSPEYLLYVRENITPYLNEIPNMFILDNPTIGFGLKLGRRVQPMRNGEIIPSIEGMIRRNTGIKSLFPHPSTLLLDASGKWIIKRDWADPRVNYKEGGAIKIKKKNRGLFTKYCGGNVTEECIRKGKSSSDPKIRKRATFVENSRKWKH